MRNAASAPSPFFFCKALAARFSASFFSKTDIPKAEFFEISLSLRRSSFRFFIIRDLVSLVPLLLLRFFFFFFFFFSSLELELALELELLLFLFSPFLPPAFSTNSNSFAYLCKD